MANYIKSIVIRMVGIYFHYIRVKNYHMILLILLLLKDSMTWGMGIFIGIILYRNFKQYKKSLEEFEDIQFYVNYSMFKKIMTGKDKNAKIKQ